MSAKYSTNCLKTKNISLSMSKLRLEIAFSRLLHLYKLKLRQLDMNSCYNHKNTSFKLNVAIFHSFVMSSGSAKSAWHKYPTFPHIIKFTNHKSM